ncbi:MAG: hypothetical protein NUV58_00120 [Candidatus Roizmanbacteria bacterium]|nr:hypothetical protein [Candidatus Roizmanbacteria bacterium]
MKVKEKIKRNGEYSEYQKIIKMVDSAHKKAMSFTKTDYQRKLEKVFSAC